jgi:hypothetical protein
LKAVLIIKKMGSSVTTAMSTANPLRLTALARLTDLARVAGRRSELTTAGADAADVVVTVM